MEWLAERDFIPSEARAAHIDGKNRLGPAQAFEPRGGGPQNNSFRGVPRVRIKATQRVPLPQASACEPSLL